MSWRGTKIEYHWTLTGTNTGPGGTGKFVKISGFEEWRFGPDGLITESLGHFDAADYERQLDVGGQRDHEYLARLADGLNSRQQSGARDRQVWINDP